MTARGSASNRTFVRPSASNVVLASRVSGDTNDRQAIQVDGKTLLGPGNTAADTTLYRSGVGALKTDGTFETVGSLFVTKSGGTSSLYLQADAGQVGQVAFRTGTTPRWAFGKDNASESGSNAGSDFDIDRFADNGSYIDTPVTIKRSDGSVNLTSNLKISRDATATRFTLDSDPTQLAGFVFQSNGLDRWQFQKSTDAETGSPANTGSHLDVVRCDDAGNAIGIVMRFYRDSGVTDHPGGINLGTRPGSTADNIQVPDTAWVRARIAEMAVIPYDLSFLAFGEKTTRAVGAGDFTLGVKLQRACTFTSITYRCRTANGLGNMVVEIRKNGAAVSGTSSSIAVGSQVSGATVTGSWAFAAGDVVTAYITTVGTSPGQGLAIDMTGTKT